VAAVADHFDRYEFHRVCQLLQRFCTVDVSSLYFDVVKDKLYTHGKNSPSRRAVQTVLEHVLQVLVRLLVPVTPYLAEDVWQNMPEKLRQAGASEESVLLADFPQWTAQFKNDELAADWADLLKVRSVCNKALELAREQKKLGKTQEAQVVLTFDDDVMASRVRALGAELPALLMVSQANVGSLPSETDVWARACDHGVTATVLRADGEKCQRCWNFRSNLGSDARFPEVCLPCTTVLEELSHE
jgi:isoleucyl-tRNA synthetase